MSLKINTLQPASKQTHTAASVAWVLHALAAHGVPSAPPYAVAGSIHHVHHLAEQQRPASAKQEDAPRRSQPGAGLQWQRTWVQAGFMRPLAESRGW